ncbi:MAG: DUF1015 domain-containing protein, partial [Oscillospiraceae bacterium]|nr:DUF1015 domain-containing protein [Oscillospiraceae bacterium]
LLMSIVVPFHGLCYTNKIAKSNNVSKVVCPPYDMISNELKLKLESKSKYNAANLEAPESYEDAKELLDKWIKDEILTFSEKPSLYLYEAYYKIENETYCMKAIIGGLKLPKDGEDYIRTHENTFEKYKSDRMELFSTTKCEFSPICALYQDDDNLTLDIISNIVRSHYIAKAKQNNVTHKIWEISDEETIKKLEQLFNNKTYYIADGHHRFATACAYRDKLEKDQKIDKDNPANYVMALLVRQNDPSLTVLPTHRLVSNIEMFDSDEILEKAAKYFNIINCQTLKSTRNTMFGYRRENKNAFGVYIDGEYKVLVLKDSEIMKTICDKSSAYRNLDVTVLHELLFNKILSLNSEQISYNQSATKTRDAVDNGDACFAVFLSATRMNEIIEMADNRENMPQKSTLFFPKPTTGLVFYPLEKKN